MTERAQDILKSVFGLEGLITLQKDVIRSVLDGKDSFAVMPTGGGKSLFCSSRKAISIKSSTGMGWRPQTLCIRELFLLVIFPFFCREPA
jgi:hypothetical protein